MEEIPAAGFISLTTTSTSSSFLEQDRTEMATWYSLLLSLAVLQSTVHCRGGLSKRGADDVWQIGSLSTDLPQCVPFEHEYCNQFGNNHTLVPNPTRPTGFEDFRPLLESGCHPDLGKFLCFAYFPFCDPDRFYDEETQPSTLAEAIRDHAIYPCHETCQAIHDSRCTELLQLFREGLEWGPHLQCDQTVGDNLPIYVSKSDTNLCISGDGGGEQPKDVKEIMISASGEKEEPTEDTSSCDCVFPETNDCPKPAKYRGTCTSKTFVRNEFEFAARVNVTSKRVSECNNVVIAVDVIGDSSYAIHPNTEALPQTIEVHTNYHEDCARCPNFKVGNEYLIAGHRSDEGCFILACDNNKSLVSEWKGKYGKTNKRNNNLINLEAWIRDGEEHHRAEGNE